MEQELELAKKTLQEIKQDNDTMSQQLKKANEENRHHLLELTRREAELTEVRNSLAKATGDNPYKSRIHNIK